jgi:putative ABC transport system permease protein
MGALDGAMAARRDDLEVRLLRPAPSDALSRVAAEVSGVRGVETWGSVLAALELPHQGAAAGVGTPRYSLLAPPEDGRFWRPNLVAGRWPRAGERDAIVVNRTLLDDEPALRGAADTRVLFAGKRTTVRIVGLIEEVAPPTMYTNAATLGAVTGTAGQAGSLRIATAPGDAQGVAGRLEEALVDRGWFTSFVMTRESFSRSMADHFLIVLLVLSTVAMSAVIVGGLGLGTTMSLAILERRREIAIVRALGATSRSVARLILLEGALIAACAAVLSVALSLPLSWAVARLVGEEGLHARMPLAISGAALVGWLGLVALITGVACLLPARRAVRLPVRDVLAYE